MKQTITFMSYNIEHMKDMFKSHQIKESALPRIEAFKSFYKQFKPDIITIVEAANKEWMHELFLEKTGLKEAGYRVARGEARGVHDIAVYYRSPFRVEAIDEAFDSFDEWHDDIDSDGVKEVYYFERKPLEIKFSINDSEHLTVITIMNKSKNVGRSTGFHQYENFALGTRKKQIAQAKKIRERIDALLDANVNEMIVVSGDFNDDPGLDPYEKQLGQSSVETIMGSIWHPRAIFTNVLRHLVEDGRKVFTLEFRDRIMHNYDERKAWLDHILVSPSMVDGRGALQLISHSGTVIHDNEFVSIISDHRPIICQFDLK
ncbi:hypothetical protein KAH37_01625 [bacterium]|nr:hypothetical protein [bacterium]